VASSVKAQGASKQFGTVHGTVQSVSGSTLTLRAAGGRVHTFDVAGLLEGQRRNLQPGDAVTLVYEPGRERVALWIDSTPDAPAAAVPGR
jgi:hypothetical protein